MLFILILIINSIFPQSASTNPENLVTHHLVDLIVGVKRTMDKLFVLVCQITLVALQDVDLSVSPPPNAPPNWHASIKNARTHVLPRVDLELSVMSSIIHLFVLVCLDIVVIHSHYVLS